MNDSYYRLKPAAVARQPASFSPGTNGKVVTHAVEQPVEYFCRIFAGSSAQVTAQREAFEHLVGDADPPYPAIPRGGEGFELIGDFAPAFQIEHRPVRWCAGVKRNLLAHVGFILGRLFCVVGGNHENAARQFDRRSRARRTSPIRVQCSAKSSRAGNVRCAADGHESRRIIRRRARTCGD